MVPEGWEWIQIKDVCEVARGGSPRPIKDYLTNAPSGINWIKIGDTTKDGKYIDSAKEKIKPEGVRKSRIVHKGDFLLTNSMSFGRPYILRIDGCIHDGWLVISPMSNSYQSDFLYYLLSSLFAYEQFSKVASGGVVTNLNSDKVADSFFPLPPYKEQIRIVEEIEKWFALIDTLETAKEDLQTSIILAKSKILNLAIHGKLFPQDPNDEPAIELLKRINPKFTPCDNAHYENVPSNWVVCKVKDVFRINPKTKADDGMEAGFVPMSNIHDSYNNNFSYELRTWGNIKKGYTHFENGDIVVAKISPCLENRKSAVMAGLPNGIGAGTTELNVFRSDYVHPLYGLLFFKSDYFISQCVGTFNGVVGQQRVSTKIIEDIALPVPPRSEQERIINKVIELFLILDNISAEL